MAPDPKRFRGPEVVSDAHRTTIINVPARIVLVSRYMRLDKCDAPYLCPSQKCHAKFCAMSQFTFER